MTSLGKKIAFLEIAESRALKKKTGPDREKKRGFFNFTFAKKKPKEIIELRSELDMFGLGKELFKELGGREETTDEQRENPRIIFGTVKSWGTDGVLVTPKAQPGLSTILGGSMYSIGLN